MNKLLLIVIIASGSLGYAACSGGPPTGSCPVEDFNGDCCIRQSDCIQDSANLNQDAAALVAGCFAIDPKRQPLMCLPTFKTADLSNCVPLNTTEICMGGDTWNGRQAYFFDVYCCK